LVVNEVVVGPFKEEEERTGITSDVIKVQDEDPDTPNHRRGKRVRRDAGDCNCCERVDCLVHVKGEFKSKDPVLQPQAPHF